MPSEIILLRAKFSMWSTLHWPSTASSNGVWVIHRRMSSQSSEISTDVSIRARTCFRPSIPWVYVPCTVKSLDRFQRYPQAFQFKLNLDCGDIVETLIPPLLIGGSLIILHICFVMYKTALRADVFRTARCTPQLST